MEFEKAFCFGRKQSKNSAMSNQFATVSEKSSNGREKRLWCSIS
jgi:hypothetical protein